MQKKLLVVAMLSLPPASLGLINLVFAASPAPQTQSEQPEASAPQGNLPDAAPEQDSSMPQPAGQQQ
ncbi:hypothetical protein DLM_1402 [Aquitalea magnusonii]|uniref:Uncharacterized protein n=1 Tax=Aquitalea magnusonii TaxID=332411 RepID=A0A3G9GHP3_9NEIS|nr:hypothetical protein [Aquitalea magnusonii]BBF85026.1 hypothetical protein DLM_1402 [Aquitalea magnusonii]